MCVCVYLNNLILKSLEFINMILVFHKKSIYSNSNVHIQFNSYEITSSLHRSSELPFRDGKFT